MADKKSKKRSHPKNLNTQLPAEDDDSNPGLTAFKRKPSRKDVRKEMRAQKKARKNTHFTSTGRKHNDTDNASKWMKVEPDDMKRTISSPKPKKKRKTKRQSKHEQHQDVAATREMQKSRICENEEQELQALEKKLHLKQENNLPKAFHDEGLDDIIDVCNAIESGSLTQHGLKINNDDSDDIGSGSGDSNDIVSGSEDDNDNDIDGGSEDNDDDSDDVDCGSEDNDDVDDYKDDDHDYNDDDDIDDHEKDPEKVDDGGDFAHEGSSRTSEEDNNEGIPNDFNNSEEGEPSSRSHKDNEDGNTDNEEARKSYEKFEKSSYDIYGGAVAKYVPPHQRQLGGDGNKQALDRLRKQLQGLLNRLSESNMSGLSNQIEELYMRNSRNDVNDMFTKLLMEACISPSLMPDGFLREHMMLVAILNSRVGSEVGAFFLQKLAIEFDKLYAGDNRTNEGKEIHNIVTLFALLYCFKVIDCTLVYDIIRRLVDSFLELDVELILLLIRLIGVEVRKESPESLKEIILQVQAKAATDTQLSKTSRTRFMLDTITALRNNNMRKIPNYDPAPIERARKVLKSVVQNTGHNDSAKLSISLSDLLLADKKGRWWIIGSAWSERENVKSSTSEISDATNNSDILHLAREQRMNTDIRRNIFCTVMTSEDYVDAFEKLIRMKLKDKQSREIVHVLIDCSLQEKSYNPFYAYLIQKFCEFNRSYRVTVQYSLWDRFKMSSSLSDHNFSNMAQLLVHLLVNKSLSLAVLKVVDFTALDKKLVTFFTHLLTNILLDYKESIVREVFSRISTLTKLDALRESLKLFMKHFLKPKRIKASEKLSRNVKTIDKDRKLEERIALAIDALTSS